MLTADLTESGFALIDFPRELTDLMLGYVKEVIGKRIVSGSADLTASVQSVDDATFDSIFDKTERIFPDGISLSLMEWVQADVVPLLGGKSATTNAPWPHRQQDVNPGDYKGAYDIYWRCVRPYKKDVGAAHADWQFWDIARDFYGDEFCPHDYDERWKIWIPLYGCNRSNSLQILPQSHLEEVPFLRVRTDSGIIKPDIESNWLASHEEDFFCPLESFEDRAIMFHDRLIHRGPMNASDKVRISAEITVLLKR